MSPKLDISLFDREFLTTNSVEGTRQTVDKIRANPVFHSTFLLVGIRVEVLCHKLRLNLRLTFKLFHVIDICHTIFCIILTKGTRYDRIA